MFTTLSIKFMKNDNLKEIFDKLEDALLALGECGTLAENLTLEGNEIKSSGNTIVENDDIAIMFNETYAFLFAEVIMNNFPEENFYIFLELEDGSSSVVHVFDGNSAGYYYTKYDEDADGPEFAYFIADEYEVDNENWEPIYYDDFEEFTFDYFMTYRGKDLSFFKGSPLSQLFVNVNLDELEEKYAAFDKYLEELNKREKE